MTLKPNHNDYKKLSIIAGVLVAVVVLLLYWFNGNVTTSEASSFMPGFENPAFRFENLSHQIVRLVSIIKL